MASTFAILLTIATLITGIFWFLEKFKWKPARQRKVEAVRKQTNGNVDAELLAKVGSPNKSTDSIASFFPVLFFVLVIRSFIFEPFQIPSGSMMPTLLIGDFIAVQKYAYGIKDPITNTAIIPISHPKRGDVAVFKYPQDPSIDFVKRVIGIPGDKIIYDTETKTLTIYPKCETENICRESSSLNLKYTDIKTSEWKEVFSNKGANFYTDSQYENLNLASDDDLYSVSLNTRMETLGEKRHDILLLSKVIHQKTHLYKQVGQDAGEWVVPEGYYFMMGDNRDNSDDSRFWGFVPEKNFVGKVSAIWVSFEKQPDEWPTGIRFNRIGSVN